jgi:2'-5' RNA ligase
MANKIRMHAGAGAPAEKERNVRLFYALWPDAATRSALIELQASIPGRLTPPEDLHLTLVFLGAQPAALLPTLQALMTELPASAMTLRLDYLGYFPKPAILWTGPQSPPEELVTLQHALLSALARNNILVDQGSRFTPHITLSRNTVAAAIAPPMTPITWRADHIALVQSATTGTASRYRLLASRWLAR